MKTTALEQIKQLLNAIQQDRKNYIALADLLKQQRGYIIERKTDAIEALNQQITTIYNALAESMKNRTKTLNDLAIPANADGMNQLFSRLPAPHQSRAKAVWDDLAQHAMECQELNARNAHILMTQQDILHGILGHQPEPIYQQR